MKRRVYFLAMFFLMVLGLTSCGKKSWNEESASQEIVKVLSKKYQTEFAVDSLEEKNIGQNFAHYVYMANVHQEGSSILFEAQLDTNNGTVTDNYPKVLYGDQMELLAMDILEKSGFNPSSLELSYDLTNEKAGSFEKYQKGFHVYVYADLLTAEYDTDEIAESLNQLFQELHDNGFYYILKLKVNGKESYFVHNDTINLPSEKEIKDEIEGR